MCAGNGGLDGQVDGQSVKGLADRVSEAPRAKRLMESERRKFGIH